MNAKGLRDAVLMKALAEVSNIASMAFQVRIFS